MRFIAVVCATLAMAVWSPGALQAAENNTILFTGDYDTFTVGSNRSWRACERACSQDPRCRAWTFIKGPRQCRLKFKVGQRMPNPCCVSGERRDQVTGTRQAYCADYARQAIESQDENLVRRCGFKGDRWGSNYSAHYRWCLRVDRNAAAGEMQTRARMVQQCNQFAGDQRSARCDHYARVAVQQSKSAQEARCGYSGARWRASYDYHLDVCRGQAHGVSLDVMKTRERDLSKCFDIGGRRDDECQTYARQAVRQFRRNANDQCGFARNARWHDNERRHYRWCLDARPRQRRREAESRRDDLLKCEQQVARRNTCLTYAQTAVQVASRAATLGCRVTGDRWNADRAVHRDFCMQRSDADLTAENNARTRRLDRCETRRASGGSCRDYGREATRQVKRAAELGCRVSGDLWSQTERAHRRFCREASRDSLQNAFEVRQTRLERCESQAQSGGDPRCDRYARRALRAQEINQARRCGFTRRVRWSSKYRQHFDFCRNNSDSQLQSQNQRRRRALVRCSRNKGFALDF
ncbi:MAG: PAN domain-containing protein [Hyphomicrobiaceae bacterium]